jgi:disulfide bond formation protein DsbB
MHISIFLILFSSLSLALAYTSEHIFGMLPCILCIYQRIPFFVVIALGLLSLAFNGATRLVFVALCAVAILAGACIAAYHVGVEHGKFHVEGGCESKDAPVSTLEEMRNQLIGKAASPCDKPQFIFLGVSMAGWNFFFSSFIGAYTLILVWRAFRQLKSGD